MQLGVRKENTYVVHINADIIFIVATLGHPAELAEMVAMGSAYNLKGAECLGVATKDSLVGIVADNGEVVVVDEFEHHIVIATLAMGSHFCQGGHLVGQHRAKTLTHGCVQFGKKHLSVHLEQEWRVDSILALGHNPIFYTIHS